MREYSYDPLGDEQIRLLRLFPAQDKAAALEGNLLIRRLRVNDRFSEGEPTLPTFMLSEEGGLSLATPDIAPPVSPEDDGADADTQTSSTAEVILEAEPYEALSYTWGGKPDPDCFIKILHGGQPYIIPITPNLESALHHLRNSGDISYLWIDALCINQQNHVEKGSQIPRIADIYNQATNVRVWLGEEKENSEVALKFIRRVLNLGQLDQLVQDELTPNEWAAFLDLMKRPWFSRRWIVQEIALAREAYLHCGDESVTWREFAEAVSLFTSKHHDVRKLFQGSPLFDHHPDFLGEIEELGANRLVYASSNLFRKSDDGTIMEHLLSLEALMSTLSVFEASNPHDVVYAILWLANDATPSTEESRGSSLNEPYVIHTPNPRSPSAETESPTIVAFPYSDPTNHRVSNEPATNNTDSNDHIERQLSSIDVSNEHSRVRAHGLQDFLAVPIGGQRKRKRAASDSSQPSSQIMLHVKRAVDRRITVDYNKTVYEVCKDFLVFAMAQSESLDIICRPWAPDPDLSKEPDLPSWIPKLSSAPFELVDKVYKRVEADPLVGSPGIGRKNYNASGKWKSIWRFKEDFSRSLFVRGFVLDTVKVKSETAQQGNIPAEWLKVVQWDHGKAAAPDRFWRTLVADRGPDGRRPPHIYQSGFNYAFQRKGQRGDLNTRELILFGKCPSLAIDFLRRVQSVIWKRSLIVTHREGFLGLAPSKVQEGDLICVLYGCSVPVVLRTIKRASLGAIPRTSSPRMGTNDGLPPRLDSSTNDHYYEFIGECYIHGMMDGEALAHQRLRKLDHQDFELR
jgi:Heterokaryon incompatibility protein (HET)